MRKKILEEHTVESKLLGKESFRFSLDSDFPGKKEVPFNLEMQRKKPDGTFEKIGYIYARIGHDQGEGAKLRFSFCNIDPLFRGRNIGIKAYQFLKRLAIKEHGVTSVRYARVENPYMEDHFRKIGLNPVLGYNWEKEISPNVEEKEVSIKPLNEQLFHFLKRIDEFNITNLPEETLKKKVDEMIQEAEKGGIQKEKYLKLLLPDPSMKEYPKKRVVKDRRGYLNELGLALLEFLSDPASLEK